MAKKSGNQQGWETRCIRLILSGPTAGLWIGKAEDEEINLEDYLKQLNSLKEILENPFPEKKEIERYVPSEAELKTLYMEMIEEFDDIPEDEISRKVLIQMTARSKYKAYRKRAKAVVKHLDFLIRNIEKMTSESGTPNIPMLR